MKNCTGTLIFRIDCSDSSDSPDSFRSILVSPSALRLPAPLEVTIYFIVSFIALIFKHILPGKTQATMFSDSMYGKYINNWGLWGVGYMCDIKIYVYYV